MKNLNILQKASCLLITLSLTLFLHSCNQSTDSEKESDGDSYAEVSDVESNCSPTWFPHSQTPPPAEGSGSPFDTTSTTNSIFHEWSWQKFLWLTKPTESGNPLFEEQLTQVDNQLMPVEPVDNIYLVLTDVGQAGSDGILMSNANLNGKSDTVYYGIYANDILLHTADSMKTVILSDTSMVNNSVSFPVGALELKTAWVKASTLAPDDLQNYYTRDAYITTEGNSASMALLGMHVVGVVINHPEFIWATFEHNNMAPNYDWAATTTEDVPVTSDEDLLFFEKGYSANIDNIKYTDTTTLSAENVFAVFEYGIPRTAKNAIMPGTSQDSSTNVSNYNNIQRLNTCVSEQLTDVWKNYFYNGSVWANTDGLSSSQQDSLMIAEGNSVGSAESGSVARGSLAAYNITMETFAQTFGVSQIHSMDASDVFNCMGCHTAEATIKIGKQTYKNSKSPLYFSHIFRSHMSASSGVEVDDIEALRIKEFVRLLEQQK